jgi:hypothetical protein
VFRVISVSLRQRQRELFPAALACAASDFFARAAAALSMISRAFDAVREKVRRRLGKGLD